MEDCTHPLLPTRQLVGLVVLIILCFSVSTVAEFTALRHFSTWYQTLEKPAWNLPRGFYSPLWSAFYLALALAAWFVWRCGGSRQNKLPLTLFAITLMLNLGWALVFFGSQNPAAAFVCAILWAFACTATATSFARLSRWAGVLMVLCVGWVGFIASLTGAIWQLNS